MIRFHLIVGVILGLALPSHAQDLPSYENLYVNDYADLLTPETEAILRVKLTDLKQDIGTEMTILTVNDMATYGAWSDIAAFGNGIFNEWGIGDADRNDGVLLVIAKNDRLLRIEVGSGYAPIYDDISEDIIQFHLTPAFKDGDFDDGVLDGAQKMITLIALQHNGGVEFPERPQKPNRGAGFVFGAMAIFFGGSIGAVVFGPMISRVRFRRRPCPNCGQTGMTKQTKTLQSATKSSSGMRETTIDCPHCSYHDVSQHIISRRTSSSNGSGSGGSSFGGGSSSGGGASGRW